MPWLNTRLAFTALCNLVCVCLYHLPAPHASFGRSVCWDKGMDAQLRQPLFVAVHSCKHPIKWPATLHWTFPHFSNTTVLATARGLDDNMRKQTLRCMETCYLDTVAAAVSQSQNVICCARTQQGLPPYWLCQNRAGSHGQEHVKANTTGEMKRMTNVYTALYLISPASWLPLLPAFSDENHMSDRGWSPVNPICEKQWP